MRWACAAIGQSDLWTYRGWFWVDVTMVTKEEILEKGNVVLHVRIAGITQRQEFIVEHHETAVGSVPFLVCKRALPVSEMLRLAEELKLPIESNKQKVFPAGTGPKDFAGL